VADNLAEVPGLKVASAEEVTQARAPLAFTGPIETVEVDSLLERTRAGNKATLVFFYASSCSSCRKMFPTVNQVARNYREQGLEVVALSLDTDESELVRYLQRTLPVFAALRAAPHDSESLTRVVSTRRTFRISPCSMTRGSWWRSPRESSTPARSRPTSSRCCFAEKAEHAGNTHGQRGPFPRPSPLALRERGHWAERV
jgi:thiol-disulfide isomerase/thioredoxin